MTIADSLTLLNSTKTAIKEAIESKGVTVGSIPFSGYPGKIAEISTSGAEPPPEEPMEWVRPSDWIELPPVSASDQKFVGLHAVFPDSNFLALSAAGNYTVDWGDGVVENFAANAIAQHEYNYTTYDVAGVTLCSQGYKQVVVVVTPQVGSNLTYLNLHCRHTSLAVKYASGFLDICLAGQYLKDLFIGVPSHSNFSQFVRLSYLEQVSILSSDIVDARFLFRECSALKSVTSFVTSSRPARTIDVTLDSAGGNWIVSPSHGLSNGDLVIFTVKDGGNGLSLQTRYYVVAAEPDKYRLSNTSGGATFPFTTPGSGTMKTGTDFNGCFYLCNGVQSLAVFDTSAGIDFSSMFSYCASLRIIPELNTAEGLNFSDMFQNCLKLQSIPSLNTAKGVNFSNMFNYCLSLRSIPLLNTGNGTSFNNMFNYCSSLQSIPLLDTGNGTSFNNMFNYCSSLKSIPLLDTGNGTSFSYMFKGCSSLRSIPLLNTAKGVSFYAMLDGCSSLQSIPLLDTGNGTNFSNMFQNCSELASVPLLNTAKGTNFSYMLSGCSLLQSIPLLDTGNGTGFNYMFQNCSKLSNIPLLNTGSGTDFSGMFNNCVSLQSIPPLNTGNGTNFGYMFSSCFALHTVQTMDMSAGTEWNLSGIFNNCSQLSRIQVTGLRFSFSVSGCKLSASRLNEIYTNLPVVTGKTITVTGNYGTVSDDPSIATAKGWTVVG